MNRVNLVMAFSFISLTVFGQAPTSQDCPNAIPICQQVYSTSVSYSGTGNIPNEINPGTSCLLQGEINDVWYTFTTQFAGNLNFTITPNDPNDDYDWAVYNLTNATCSQIFNNPSLEIGCNYSPNIGCGGTTGPNGSTGGPCGAQNGPVIPVLPGQTFVINVSNFSSTQFGYTIDFTSSTGSIFDIYPPSVSVAPSVTCGSTTVDVTFYENVTCASVQPADFTLTGPGGPYSITAVSSAGCVSGAAYDKTFTLAFSPAISIGGNYTLTIVNSVNDLCGNASATNVSYVMPVSSPTLTPAHTDVLCNGDLTGSINVQTSGGVGPFSYQWSPNVSSASSASNIAAGTYTITVTGASGCPSQTTVVIAQPPAITVQNQNVIPADCGGNNGSISPVLAGGVLPYSYAWSNGAVTSSVQNLFAGVYTLTVTDANNCTHSQTFNVAMQNTLNASVASIQNVSCFGGNNGSLTINTTGGSGNYTFQWVPNVSITNTAVNIPGGNYSVTVTDGPCATTLNNLIVVTPSAPLTAAPVTNTTTCGNANGSSILNANGGTLAYTYQWSSGGSGAAATGLVSGAYTVTITDANGCTHIQNFNIGASSGPQPAVNYLQQTVSCFGNNNGSATINVIGGLAPYTYVWSGGLGSGNSKNNLAAGNYTVTVTDNANCAATVPVTINTPVQLTASVGSIQHVKCFGQTNGTATIIASGGTGLLSFAWSPSGGNAAAASNLQAGNYSVVVTDANGCTALQQVIIIQPASALQGNITSTPTICGNTNGTAVINVSGGSFPYAYVWSNGNTTSNINSLSAGNYSCTVADANLCSVTYSTNIAASSAVIISNAAIQNLTCANISNGSISITPSGGVLPYSFAWSAGGSTSNTSNSLSAGIYNVTVTDNAGCSTSANYNVTSPTAISINLAAQQNVSCFGGSNGSISLVVSGGTGSLSYQWSPVAGSGSSISNLVSKTYSVVVTDQNNCSATQSYFVSQPASALTSTLNTIHTTCGFANGSIAALTSGGTLPYNFVWSNSATASSIQNLASGNYYVTVTDANGCTYNQSTIVHSSTPVMVSSSSSTDVLCFGNATGSATITISGGVAPFSYAWSNGQTLQTANQLVAGNYSVLVTDAVGCTTAAVFTILQPADVQITPPAMQTVCKNQPTSINPVVIGGVLPYQYIWSTGAMTSALTVSPTTSAAYTVTVTDANGCTKISTPVSLNVFPDLAINPLPDSVVCEGSTISYLAAVSGGNGVYQYDWGGGFGIINLYTSVFNSTTSYTLAVKDGCGETVTENFDVTVIPNPDVKFTTDNDSGCKPFNVYFIDQTQAVAGSVYSWNFGDGNFSSASTSTANSYYNAGLYNISLTVTTPAPQLCTATYVLPYAITSLEKPVAAFSYSPAEITVLNPLVEFKNQSTHAWIYTWSFGDGQISYTENPEHVYHTFGINNVVLSASNNFCSDTAIAEINITDVFSFYIPNAFSPDGDGKNETFTAYGTNITQATVNIFNRWGQQVFTSNSFPFYWNGSLNNSGNILQQGVYVYAISATDKFGGKHIYKGKISLVK